MWFRGENSDQTTASPSAVYLTTQISTILALHGVISRETCHVGEQMLAAAVEKVKLGAPFPARSTISRSDRGGRLAQGAGEIEVVVLSRALYREVGLLEQGVTKSGDRLRQGAKER